MQRFSPKYQWNRTCFKQFKHIREKKQGSIQKLGGGFKDFLVSSLFGEDSQFDYYFSNGLKPPTRKAAPEFFVSDPSSTGYVSTGRFSTYGRGRDCTRRFVDGYVVVNSFGCQR